MISPSSQYHCPSLDLSFPPIQISPTPFASPESFKKNQHVQLIKRNIWILYFCNTIWFYLSGKHFFGCSKSIRIVNRSLSDLILIEAIIYTFDKILFTLISYAHEETTVITAFSMRVDPSQRSFKKFLVTIILILVIPSRFTHKIVCCILTFNKETINHI